MQANQQGRERSPGGSGRLDQSEFEPFVEILIELVVLFRNERAAQYDLRATQRDQANVLHQLDEQRLELLLIQEGLRRSQSGDEGDETEAKIQSLNHDLIRRRDKTQTFLAAQERRQEVIYETMQRLFEFEPAVVNASFRPDYPRLSPLFYRRLRQLKAGQDLLERDRRRSSSTRVRLEKSLPLLIIATETLRNRLEVTANGVPGATNGLETAIRELYTTTCEHKELAWESEYRNMVLDARTKTQQVRAMSLFLDIAAPALEREKLVNRDRLRTSVLQEYTPGEPAFVSNDPPPELTDLQREAVRAEVLPIYEEYDRCKAMMRSIKRNYWEDLADFKEAFHDCTKSDFDILDLRDQREAAQHLTEAWAGELRADHLGMEVGMNARDHDYLSQPEDGNASRASSGPDIERAERKQRRNADIEHWIYQIGNEGGNPGDQPYPAPLDYWNGGEVGFQDKDRASDVSMGSNARRLVKKLLETYQRDCRDMREEMHGPGSETSSEASRWCC